MRPVSVGAGRGIRPLDFPINSYPTPFDTRRVNVTDLVPVTPLQGLIVIACDERVLGVTVNDERPTMLPACARSRSLALAAEGHDQR